MRSALGPPLDGSDKTVEITDGVRRREAAAAASDRPRRFGPPSEDRHDDARPTADQELHHHRHHPQHDCQPPAGTQIQQEYRHDDDLPENPPRRVGRSDSRTANRKSATRTATSRRSCLTPAGNSSPRCRRPRPAAGACRSVGGGRSLWDTLQRDPACLCQPRPRSPGRPKPRRTRPV